MLDTIKLTLDKTMFWLNDRSKFERNTMNPSRGYYILVQNPTKGELKSGIYKPRLTLSHRFNCSGKSEETLAIELSLPKLLYGNNFNELVLNDYQAVTEKLGLVLREMGVMVFRNVLDSAPVSLVHYSKNIPLTDGSTPNFLIERIKETNIALPLDVNQTDYRNGGHCYKWHSNSYEVAFYDKLKDLEVANRSEKRAVETDNILQLNLLDDFQRRKCFEVLRMEVRLNNRQKIRQLFRKLNICTELTYQNLFDPSISQKVLLHYLDEIESNRLTLFDYKPITPKALLADLLIQNPGLSPGRTVQLYGLKQVFEMINPRELRAMFGKHSKRSWYRLMAQAKGIKLPRTASPLSVIRRHLTCFEPLKLVDFQEQMLNNDKYN